MQRFELISTADGSFTVKDTKLGETFHSIHGAMSESHYVFIQQGLLFFKNKSYVSIFEMGFGTGLNAFLTLLHKAEHQTVYYETIDKYPIPNNLFEELIKNFSNNEKKEIYRKILECPWNITTTIAKDFIFTKNKANIETFLFNRTFDLIYFDAFSTKCQPELWTKNIFKKFYFALNPDGILVTYACNRVAKEQLKAVGFEVERIKGALNKKHMLRAKKN